jgi:hypothetical protein
MKNIIDDGVIKFSFSLKKTGPLLPESYLDIEKWRVLFYKMNLIGEYPSEKIGFGNLSKRIQKGKDEFIITGSQTGHLPHLEGHHYTKITKCIPEKNLIESIGPISPSSESMTHWSLYKNDSSANYIFHVHHNELWNFLINKMQFTDHNIKYGTVEMANAMMEMVNRKLKIFAMGGHLDGVIAYGPTADEVGKLVIDTFRMCRVPENNQ